MEDYSKVFKIGEVYNCKVTRAIKEVNDYAEVSLIDGIGQGGIISDLELKIGEIYPLKVCDFAIVPFVPQLIFEPTLEAYVLCGNRPKLLTLKIEAMSHTKLLLKNPEYLIIFDRKDLPFDTNWSRVLHSIEVAQFKSRDKIRNIFAGLVFVDGSKVPLYDWEAKSKWEDYKQKESCFYCANWQVGKTYALEFNNGWREIESGKYAEIINPTAITSRAGFVLAGLVDIAGGVPKFEVLKSFKLDK